MLLETPKILVFAQEQEGQRLTDSLREMGLEECVRVVEKMGCDEELSLEADVVVFVEESEKNDITRVLADKVLGRTPVILIGARGAHGSGEERSAELPQVEYLPWSFENDELAHVLANASPKLVDFLALPGRSPARCETTFVLAGSSKNKDAQAARASQANELHQGDLATGTDAGAETDVATKLRRKMSVMAERLFPHEAQPLAKVAEDVSSAAHTEIDLGAIVPTKLPHADEELGTTRARTGETSETQRRTSDSNTSSEQGPSFDGNLSTPENDVARVLARLWQSNFSGECVLSNGTLERRIYFEEGRVVFATRGRLRERTSDAPDAHTTDEHLGDLLVREGKIGQAEREEAAAVSHKTGRRLGEILVDRGYLKPRELLPAVRQHLEEVVFSAFPWTSGSYNALPEVAIDERIRLSRHPAALILEGVRRKYDGARLAEVLCQSSVPMKHVIVEAQKQTDDTHVIILAADLSPDERAVVGMFDGHTCLGAIAKQSSLSLVQVGQLAYVWVCLGLAATRSDKSSENVPLTPLVDETDLRIDRRRVLSKYALVREGDYFQILGVRRDASRFEIRRAYESTRRALSSEVLDSSVCNELCEERAEVLEVLKEAYEILTDAQLREVYQANLKAPVTGFGGEQQ